MLRWTTAIVLGSLIAAAPSPKADDEAPTPGEDEPPVLVVLATAEAEPGLEREQRFITELGLGLDGFELSVLDAPAPDFERRPMAEQIQLLKPMLEQEWSKVAVWLEKSDTDVILLHLIALDTGRALARIIEVRDNPNAESELALAAAELLGEAYMFTPKRAPAVARKVAEVEDAIVTTAPEEEEIVLRWGLAVFGAVGYGIVGNVGPSLQGGVGGGLEFIVAEQLLLRLSLTADLGPQESTGPRQISVFGVRPRMTAAYLWRLGFLASGPAIGVAGQWTQTEINLGDGPSYSFDRWNARFSLGPEIRFSLSSRIDLLITADAGMWSDVETNRRLSNDRIAYATPRFDWRASIGMIARIR